MKYADKQDILNSTSRNNEYTNTPDVVAHEIFSESMDGDTHLQMVDFCDQYKIKATYSPTRRVWVFTRDTVHGG